MRGKEKDIAQIAEKRKRIMEIGFRLFAEKGFDAVTMPQIAEASGVSRGSLYQYFSSKPELVVAIATWKWAEYIAGYNAALPKEDLEQMTGAARLRRFLDAFLDLYRNHKDILRYNYIFNIYFNQEAGAREQKRPYVHVVDRLGTQFHKLYERGMRDGTLNPAYTEQTMLSSSFHIMLAAVTRYAVGLVVVYENGSDPENELVLLEEMILSTFTME